MKVFLRELNNKKEINLTRSPSIEIVLSDGAEIEVELFERAPGRLSVRTTSGGIMVHPIVTNVIEIEGEYKNLKYRKTK